MHRTVAGQGQAAAAKQAAAAAPPPAAPLTSEEAQQQAEAEGLTLLKAGNKAGYSGVRCASAAPAVLSPTRRG